MTTISQSNGNEAILKTISVSPHKAASELKSYMFHIDSTLGFVYENQQIEEDFARTLLYTLCTL